MYLTGFCLTDKLKRFLSPDFNIFHFLEFPQMWKLISYDFHLFTFFNLFDLEMIL